MFVHPRVKTTTEKGVRSALPVQSGAWRRDRGRASGRACSPWSARAAIGTSATRRERRAFAHQCLDWSERRAHLAGALGAAVARRCLELRWVQRVAEERTLTLSPLGVRGLRTWFGINWKRAGG